MPTEVELGYEGELKVSEARSMHKTDIQRQTMRFVGWQRLAAFRFHTAEDNITILDARRSALF